MERIVLRHLSGSKAGRVEEFPLNQYNEIVIGRDPSSTVHFSEADAMVGRQHLKLFRHPSSPAQIVVSDLNSRNGTFLNGQRVTGSSVLRSGDVLQCGQSGPELRFEYIPHGPAETAQLGVPPAQPYYPPAHPLAHISGSSSPPIRPVAQVAPVQPVQPVPSPPAPAQHAPVQSKAPGKSALPLVLGGGGLLALLTVIGGIWFYRNYAMTATNGTEKNPTVASSPAVANGDGKLVAPVASGAKTTEAEKDQQSSALRETASESKNAVVTVAVPSPAPTTKPTAVKAAPKRVPVRISRPVPKPRKKAVVADVETAGKKKKKQKQGF